MTHTLGPWAMTDHGDRRHREFAIMSMTGNKDDNGSGKIASVYAGFGHHFTFEQAKANAHLIAAAPDMLVELKRLAAKHGEQATVDIIAKATGE